VKNTDEAGLLLGIAYLRANKKAEATTGLRHRQQRPGPHANREAVVVESGARPDEYEG
jgi:hypothetical protein